MQVWGASVGLDMAMVRFHTARESQHLHPLRIPGILNLDPALADEIRELPNHVMASLLGRFAEPPIQIMVARTKPKLIKLMYCSH